MIPLLLITGLIWLLTLLHQFAHRGFMVLLIWLLVGPVMSNLVLDPGENPFFRVQNREESSEMVDLHRTGYLRDKSDAIGMHQLLDPTRSLLALFVVVLILDAMLKRKHLATFDTTEIWMGIFSLILLLGVFLQSYRLIYGLRVTSDAFLVPFLTYFVTRRLVTDEFRFRLFIRIMIYTGFYLVVLGITERLANQVLTYRLAGPFKSPIALYVVAMVTFFSVLLDTLCYDRFYRKQLSLPRAIRWVVLFVTPAIIFLTFSRGNWAGFLIGIWIFLFIARRNIGFPQKVVMLGLVLVSIPIFIISVITFVPIEIVETRIGGTGTIYARIGAWMTAIEKGTESPVFGIGLNNLRNVLHETRTQLNGVYNLRSVHNSFLAILAEQGIVGLLVYMALVISIIRKGLKIFQSNRYFEDKWRGITVIAVLTGYLTPALFASTLHATNVFTHIYVYAFIGAIAGLYNWGQLRANVSRSLRDRLGMNRDASVYV
jgi:putative inorganic carbon (hco3(-)) transporter